MVLKKSKSDNNTLFIDASKKCVKITNSNKLTQDNIASILKVFTDRQNIDYVAKLVSNDEIAKQDYNLSVSAYVEKEDTREVIDIAKLNADIEKIVLRETELRTATAEIIRDLEGEQ